MQLALTLFLMAAGLAGPQIISARRWGRDGLNASTLSISMFIVLFAIAVGISAFRPSYYNPGGGLGLSLLMGVAVAFVIVGIGRLAAQFMLPKSAESSVTASPDEAP